MSSVYKSQNIIMDVHSAVKNFQNCLVPVHYFQLKYLHSVVKNVKNFAAIT